MSDYQIRALAAACAPRIAAKVEAAVIATVRAELAGTIVEVLREQFPGNKLRLYVSKRDVTARRDRDNLIRARFTGHNAVELGHQFDLSAKQILRIARGTF